MRSRRRVLRLLWTLDAIVVAFGLQMQCDSNPTRIRLQSPAARRRTPPTRQKRWHEGATIILVFPEPTELPVVTVPALEYA
jgi:hypothetical protein